MEELLKTMEDYAAAHHVPIIQAAGRKVLTAAAQKQQAHHILEIGTAIGYSALLLLQHSAPDAAVTTLEMDAARAAQARLFIDQSPFREHISICQGDAGELLKELTGSYDLVFIDAAKGQYPRYWNKICPLLADDATVIADNVLFRGMVRSEEKAPHRYRTIVTRLREYIRLAEAQLDFETKIYEDGDGLAVSTRRRKHSE